MKKKILLMGCITALAMGLASCGQPASGEEGDSTESTVNSSVAESVPEKEEDSAETPEEIADEELPNWKGVMDKFIYDVYAAGRTYVGRVSINIEYPSLTPTSFGWAYQLDPAYVFVTSPGFVVVDGKMDINEDLLIESLEDTFEATKPYILWKLKTDRNPRYRNFDFEVETAEPVTINDLSMYKYTGTHTYTYEEEDRQCDFVAYSVDTKQAEHSYFTIIVIDDSLSNPSMDPLPEGTIEAYARKMAESITLRE